MPWICIYHVIHTPGTGQHPKETCTAVFILEPSTVGRLPDWWIWKGFWHRHTMECYSSIKMKFSQLWKHSYKRTSRWMKEVSLRKTNSTFTLILHIFKDRLIYMKDRVTKRGKEMCVCCSICWFTPEWPQKSCLCRFKARSPCECRVPSSFANLCYFPRCIGKNLDQRWSRTRTSVYVQCWFHRHWLNSLHHSAGPALTLEFNKGNVATAINSYK